MTRYRISVGISAVSLLLFIATTSADSGVLINHPQKLVQPDGSIVYCYTSGDEYHRRLHDASDFTIIQHPRTGYFVYAALDNEALAPTAYIAGRDNPAAAGLAPGVDLPVSLLRLRPEASLARSVPLPGHGSGTVGLINNIVIFVRFADEPRAAFPDAIAGYERMFNAAEEGANSLYGYFREASYNRVSITSTFYPLSTDSVLSYMDSHTRNYFRKYNAITNPAGYSTDNESRIREQTLLSQAIRSVAGEVPAGLNFDANGDGWIDNVCFIVSGDVDAWGDLLWPHMTSLAGTGLSIRGKYVGTYNVQLRNHLLASGNSVYVLAHEMFHSLGAPDLYHYSQKPPSPVGAWDIMHHSRNPPVHMSAHMKWKYGGWIDAIPTITKAGTYTLAPLFHPRGTASGFRRSIRQRSTSFWSIARESGIFERSLPGEGLLVYRVNPERRGNADGPPDELYLYRPFGTLTENGQLDLAPLSATGITMLTDTTSIRSFLSDGSPGGLSITGVGPLGDSISFTVDFPRVPVLTLNARAIYFEPIGDAAPYVDTAFVVRNAGFGPDSITTNARAGSTIPDSCWRFILALSPSSLAIRRG